jgi:putative addiction module antidote
VSVIQFVQQTRGGACHEQAREARRRAGHGPAGPQIGNSVGIILPKELLARLKLAEGDKLTVVEQPELGLKLTRYDDTHARGLEIARRLFKTYANTYRALAK